MSFTNLLALATLIALPLSAVAQQKQASQDPSHAQVLVPAIAYTSAFASYQAAIEERETPDQTWRAANNAVEKLRGHAGHIKTDIPDSAASPAQTAPVDHGAHH